MSAIIWLVQTITSCLCLLRAALTDTYSNYKSFRDSQSIIRYYFVIRVFCVQGLLSEVPFFLPFGTLTIGFQSILVTDKSWAGRCPGTAGTHWSNYEEIGAYYFLVLFFSKVEGFCWPTIQWRRREHKMFKQLTQHRWYDDPRISGCLRYQLTPEHTCRFSAEDVNSWGRGDN